MQYATNKGADQPTHPRSLISSFVVRCLDSITTVVVISEISRLYLACVFEPAGLIESYLAENPKDRFSDDEAQLLLFDFNSGSHTERVYHYRKYINQVRTTMMKRRRGLIAQTALIARATM